jgi:dimethylhistidine N-methyltransferase
MMAPSPHPRFTLIGLPAEERLAKFARDVASGLTASPRHLPCCYFYDRLGSRLFEAICELPEYYLTRAETVILQAHAEEIADLFPTATDLIELGSGSAAKTRLLLEAFLRRPLTQPSPSVGPARLAGPEEVPLGSRHLPEAEGRVRGTQRYVPLDICRTVLEESSLDLLRTYPTLEILAIAGEYYEGLEYLRAGGVGRPAPSAAAPRKLILWLGSNIGNLERGEAARFLARVRQTLTPDDRLLVGIDLRKDRATLEAAYEDACGVTAAFNRNILGRVNRELGAHFDLQGFQHRAVYNEEVGRVEMYLVSTRPQQVAIDRSGIVVRIAAGEAIHTENSYKYSRAEIEALAASAGLLFEQHWLDPDGLFSVNLFACR